MTDPIAAARALIEPLTGYTPGPWNEVTPADNLWPPRVFAAGSKFVCMVDNSDDTQERRINDARLIAAAPDLRDMVATLADALEAERAKVAAAYEAAEGLCKRRYRDYEQMMANAERSGPSHPEYICDSTFHHWSGKSSAYSEMSTDIRNLTPDEAQAALDKMLAEARLEGWRAGRDAAADCAEDYCSDMPDLAGHGHSVGLRDAIRALPEPKEVRHD